MGAVEDDCSQMARLGRLSLWILACMAEHPTVQSPPQSQGRRGNPHARTRQTRHDTAPFNDMNFWNTWHRAKFAHIRVFATLFIHQLATAGLDGIKIRMDSCMKLRSCDSDRGRCTGFRSRWASFPLLRIRSYDLNKNNIGKTEAVSSQRLEQTDRPREPYS